MEEQHYYYYSSSKMNPSRIMRKSIFTFLQNFHHLSSTPSLLLLPFVASVLVSPPLLASSRFFPLVHGRLRSLFVAAGIPPQSELFAILNLKLSQTILSFIFSLPFSLSFFLLAKAAAVALLRRHSRTPLSLIATLNRLLLTHLCNSLLILSANATCFSLLAAAFNFSDAAALASPGFRLALSATGAVAYSIILANAYVVSTLALVIAAMDDSCGGFAAVLHACVAIRGRASAALSLAVPMNMAMAAVEALFQYRILAAYRRSAAVTPALFLEGMLVAYIYAMVLVLDTVVSYVFLKNCREEEEEEKKKDFFSSQRIEFFGEIKALDSKV